LSKKIIERFKEVQVRKDFMEDGDEAAYRETENDSQWQLKT